MVRPQCFQCFLFFCRIGCFLVDVFDHSRKMKIFFLRKVAGQVLVSFSFGSSSILRGRVLETFGGIFLVRKIATLIFMEGLCFFSFFFQDFCFCYLFYVTESQTYIHLVMENVPSIYEVVLFLIPDAVPFKISSHFYSIKLCFFVVPCSLHNGQQVMKHIRCITSLHFLVAYLHLS